VVYCPAADSGAVVALAEPGEQDAAAVDAVGGQDAAAVPVFPGTVTRLPGAGSRARPPVLIRTGSTATGARTCRA